MDRRRFLLTSLAGAFAAPVAGQAQATRKVNRIGYLSTQSSSTDVARIEVFRRGLRDLGYVEGQNLVVEYRFAEGKLDRLADFATELVRLNVDAILTGGSPGTRAALRATRTIPLVMTVVGDPVEAGFVTSLARPGGSVTGLTQMSPQLVGKRLELLKEAFPRVVRVAVFADAALRAAALRVQRASFQEARAAGEALGMTLQWVEVQGPNPDLDAAFKAAMTHGTDALMPLAGPTIERDRTRLVNLAAKRRLPAIYPTSEFVEVGGLMSYGPDRLDLVRRAATYVDKILRGAKPADLPVEQPTKFEFVINLKTAKALGLTIPPSLLLRADQVIE